MRTRRSRRAPGQLPLDDPIAVEIERAAVERREREEAAKEEFRRDWAARMARPDPTPALFTSQRHEHDETCWGPVQTHRAEWTSWQSIKARRCRVSGTYMEVE